jgi:hypothetical protein
MRRERIMDIFFKMIFLSCKFGCEVLIWRLGVSSAEHICLLFLLRVSHVPYVVESSAMLRPT